MRIALLWILGLFAVGAIVWHLATRPTLSTEQEATILLWMECDECNEGELDSVLSIGIPSQPHLISYLRQGPPAGRLTEHRQYLGALHAQLARYAVTHPEIGTVRDSTAYTQSYLDDYVATYRSRAAIALALLGGQVAREELEAGLLLPARTDVIDHIRYALDSLWSP